MRNEMIQRCGESVAKGGECSKLAQHEVTNEQYRQFKPRHEVGAFNGHSLNEAQQPVVEVSYEDAIAYANWLTEQNGGKYEFRLPREAEWEYACRAGTTTARFWGNSSQEACQYASVADETSKKSFDWHEGHQCNDSFTVTAPMGSFQANDFNLYDMLGNVWEWTQDTYSETGHTQLNKQDPIYTGSGEGWVVRGGGWRSYPRGVRCALRYSGVPGFRNLYVGFRLARIR